VVEVKIPPSDGTRLRSFAAPIHWRLYFLLRVISEDSQADGPLLLHQAALEIVGLVHALSIKSDDDIAGT
jgi:hypothetical protein